MKILYLHSNSLDITKANMHQTVAMCNAFADSGNDVILMVPTLGYANKQRLKLFKKNYNSINFKVYFRHVSLKEKLSRYTNTSFKCKEIEDIDYDIIFTRDPSSLHAALHTKKKILFEIHNNKIHQKSTILNYYWSTFVKKISKLDRFKLITISESLRDYWINLGVQQNDIFTLHDGFDFNSYEKILDQNLARKDLGLELQKKYACYTGSLDKDRGIDNLIHLASKITSIEVIVVGGTPTQVRFYKKIANDQKLSNIKFVGRVNHQEIPKYLYASDYLIGVWSKHIPTINYCSPLKIFEYMAAGKIIVAQGYKTIKEVLKNGYNSVIIEPDSKESLVEAFNDIINNEENYSKIGNQARKDAFEQYSWKVRVEKIFKSINIKQ
jgi:glycosyltransferase involved in cell wall biosynthesis